MAINLLGTPQKRRIQLEWVKPIFIENPFLIVCYRNDRFPPFKSWYFEGYNVDVYFSSLGYLWYKWLNNIRRQAWQESGLFSPVIFLPLLPASLTHTNPQKRKINYDMHPVGRKDRSTDRSIWTCALVEISRSCNFCGSYYLTMHISFSLCCTLK